jgi:AraC-like DNA-binding protein
MTTLLEAVRRHADAGADELGIAQTGIPGLSTVRATRPSELLYAINRPLVALVLQGTKRVTTGQETLDFGADASLVIAADVPTVSQITRADLGVPYYSLVFELDRAVIESLTQEMMSARETATSSVWVDQTEVEVADAALRLMRLLDRPSALPVLQTQLVREFHYWLLAGRHGAMIRALGISDSHAQRIARAVAVVREGFAQPLRVDRLAEVAGMSPSSFHHHFRAITSLSPLQFQKQLRLIEARRMMVSDGAPSSNAAYAVGYESVPQFTREYSRMFGVPPARDMKLAQTRMRVAA